MAEQVKQALAEAGIPLTPEELWNWPHVSEARAIEQMLAERDEMIQQGDSETA